MQNYLIKWKYKWLIIYRGHIIHLKLLKYLKLILFRSDHVGWWPPAFGVTREGEEEWWDRGMMIFPTLELVFSVIVEVFRPTLTMISQRSSTMVKFFFYPSRKIFDGGQIFTNIWWFLFFFLYFFIILFNLGWKYSIEVYFLVMGWNMGEWRAIFYF